jgi:hypothetical protein
MGIFDFFKNKTEKENKEEKIKSGELKKYTEYRRNKLNERKAGFLREVKERLNLLISEFKDEIDVLKKIRLDDIKIEERAKFIVKENLFAYISLLQKLSENLKNISFEQNPENIIKEIDDYFVNFSKKSYMNFEKATFLIGKEMGNVKESISGFFREFRNIVDENKELLEDSRLILTIDTKLLEIEKLKEIYSNIEIERDENLEKIKNLKEKANLIEKNISKFKMSKEYKERDDKKHEFERKKEQLANAINELRTLIDFKTLQKIYHTNSKKMSLLSDYVSDFKEEFNKDNGRELINLIEEARINAEEVKLKSEKIIQLKHELEETSIGEDKILIFNNELEETKNEIENIHAEDEKNIKRLDRINENIKEVMQNLRKELEKFNIVVEN